MNIREASVASGTRPPAAAGRFYPADSGRLRRQVKGYLDVPSLETPARAVIAPHASYRCSGAVAGRALVTLGGSERDGLFVMLGPAHYWPVHGVGLPVSSAFGTPLGDVPVAVDVVDGLAARGAPYARTPDAHRPEHCLEVMLPFLQLLRPHARIVPLLLDDWVRPEELANDLAFLLKDHSDARLVISSDLSHYHAYNDAVVKDDAFLNSVVHGQLERVRHGEACGRQGILVGLHLAQRLGWRAQRLAYCNSGDTCGPRREVVGYGAVAFFD